MKPVLAFPCYEPAGYRLELTEADLLQHMLIIGSTGCGKTTLITSAIKQLLAHDSRPGLLVLDAKQDGLVAQVRAEAELVGRSDDVLVFGPEGDAAFDLFSGADSECILRRLMLGVEPFGRDNAFWQQSTVGMLSAALVLIQQTLRPLIYERAVELMRQWFMSTQTPAWVTLAAERLLASSPPHPASGSTGDQVKLWETLEPRTRSNVQACLLQVLRPLTGAHSAACFIPRGRPIRSPALVATAGKVCVVSVPALTDPDLARLFFRIAKAEFFEAVQSRRDPPHGLCFLIADEYPLLTTDSDVAQLGTVRSKRCGVIAATQGLDSLTQRLGPVASRAVVNHFNTTVYMRCREAETAVSAFITLGNRREKPRPPRETGWLATPLAERPNPPEAEIPVCPVGALARLAAHQAFILQPDGRRTVDPVWFVPWFEMSPAPPPVPAAITPPAFTAERVLELMQQAGFKLCWPANVILKAAALTRRRRHRKALKQVNAFFLKRSFLVPEGLETLPEQWLGALPGILTRWAPRLGSRLPFTIRRVQLMDGMLSFDFGGETGDTLDNFADWNRLVVTVNRAIYPSRWRPLQAADLAILRRAHPEMNLAPEGQSPAF